MCQYGYSHALAFGPGLIHLLVLRRGTLDCRLLGLVVGALLNAPVEDVVVLEALANEQVAEEFPEVGVIGLVIEAEGTAVIEEDTKLAREATAE